MCGWGEGGWAVRHGYKGEDALGTRDKIYLLVTLGIVLLYFQYASSTK